MFRGSLPLCMLALGACLPVPLENRRCSVNADCIDGFTCVGAVCVTDPGEPPGCADDADCAADGAGFRCRERECIPPANVEELLDDDCTRFIFDPAGGDVVDSVADPAQTVLVGALLPLTRDGAEDPAGVARANAIELAARQVDGAGGIFGRRFVALACDSQGDAAVAERVLAHLAEIRVPAVISADDDAALVEPALGTGILTVASAATAASLSAVDDDGLVLRTAGSIAGQGAALGHFLVVSQPLTIALLSSSSPDGAALRQNVTDVLCAAGDDFDYDCADDAAFLARELPLDLNVSAIVDEVGALQPNFVVILGDAQESRAVVDAVVAEPALAASRIVLTESGRSVDVVGDLAGLLLERVRGVATAPVPEGETFLDFDVERAIAFGDGADDAFAANAYDAAVVVALAFGAVGDELRPRGAQLASAIAAKLSDGDAVKSIGLGDAAAGTLSLAEGLALLEGGATIDLVGASGPLDFDAVGDVGVDVELWRSCETSAGFAPVSLGIWRGAAGDDRTTSQSCPSCGVTGCPVGTQCASIFTTPRPLCVQPCATAGEACVTRLGESGLCATRDDENAVPVTVCLGFGALNQKCGDRHHRGCNQATGAGNIVCNLAAGQNGPGDAFEGYCIRPCNPADPVSCTEPDYVAGETCGCPAGGAFVCSTNVAFVESGDGFCALPTQAGDACNASIGADQLTLCTNGPQVCGADNTCQP